MKHYLEALVNYALKKGLIEPGDEGFAFNRLLEVMGLDAAEDGAACAPAALPEILAALTEDAVRRGICGESLTARDLFDTRLMGVLTPFPMRSAGASGLFTPKARKRLRTGTTGSAGTPITSAGTGSRGTCAGSTPVNTGRWISR